MALPDGMKCIVMEGVGGPEVMKLGTGPLPTPKPDEVLLRVWAAGVNRPDIAQRQGSYPPQRAPRRCWDWRSPETSSLLVTP